jgi:hypothetical protein
MVESPPSPLYLLGNIQTEKSKKKSYSVAEVPGWGRSLDRSSYISNEHREGKNGEKNLVPVRFSLDIWKSETSGGRQGQQIKLSSPVNGTSINATLYENPAGVTSEANSNSPGSSGVPVPARYGRIRAPRPEFPSPGH